MGEPNPNEPKFADKIQQGISDKILPMLERVIQNREKYWQQNPAASANASQVPTVISRSARRCALIGFGCNLVPGPLGLVAILPEISLILQEQLEMLYDIGHAYGHTNISKELLLGVLLSGSGTGTGGLIVIVGGKVVVKRASLQLIQRLIAILGGRITRAVLKSMLTKWVPVVGAAAMAAWARYTTIKLGEAAQKIFVKQIVMDSEVLDSEAMDSEVPSNQRPVSQTAILVERARLLVALTWIDRAVDKREQDFVMAVLQDPDLPTTDRAELEASLKSGKVSSANYEVFVGHADDQLATIMDLITLARIDSKVHPDECSLIREVGKNFGLPESEVEEMMAIEFEELRGADSQPTD